MPENSPYSYIFGLYINNYLEIIYKVLFFDDYDKGREQGEERTDKSEWDCLLGDFFVCLLELVILSIL